VPTALVPVAEEVHAGATWSGMLGLTVYVRVGNAEPYSMVWLFTVMVTTGSVMEKDELTVWFE
jgi:hypothetical protein